MHDLKDLQNHSAVIDYRIQLQANHLRNAFFYLFFFFFLFVTVCHGLYSFFKWVGETLKSIQQ